jgi:hypothetical protein
MSDFFTQFPLRYYNNQITRDITRRGEIVEKSKNAIYNYYLYELQHELRADQVSEYYYEDSRLDWLVYLANDTVDPYYDWYNSEREMNDLLTEKYGSIEKSIKKIAFYRNNWYSDQDSLSEDFYRNTLPKDYRKYYVPVFSENGTIRHYERKREDWVVNSNRIIEYQISSNNNTLSISVGELVDIKLNGSDTVIANGECEAVNSSIIRVKNVSGETTANSTVTLNIVGEDAGGNVSSSNSSIFFQNFTNSEIGFWDSVSYYDLEHEYNESKKNMYLVSNELHDILVTEFSEKISEGANTSGFVSD